MNFSSDRKKLRLGVIGLSEGNGHPYSWSAIFNGYNAKEVSRCSFSVIPEYLAKQNFPDDAIPNAQVTHIWTQDKKISCDVAMFSNIEHVVDQCTDMIGEVDAILLARDDADTHMAMSLPFIDAGLPIYIDKPIATNLETLQLILDREQYPGQIFSCSALRFAKEFQLSTAELGSLGEIQYVDAIIGKKWGTYGVHIIEPVLTLLNLSMPELVEIIHHQDKKVVIAHWPHLLVNFTTLGEITSPVVIRLYGTEGVKELQFRDTFFAFKKALEAFIWGFTLRKHVIDHSQMQAIVSIIESGSK